MAPTTMLIAGVIVTAQGAVWVPVTPQTMLQPVPAYIQTSNLGSVTRYKNGVEQPVPDNKIKTEFVFPASRF